MEKVYKALYKTDSIYATGFIVMKLDGTIEGLFALDYMCIYEENKRTTVFLKTTSYFILDTILRSETGNHEFYSSYKGILPSNTYIFFDSSNIGLYLEIQEEVTNYNHINEILLNLEQVRA